MKQIFTLLSFLLFSLTGFCDTLDFWHVYLNDNRIAEFNTLSKDFSLELKKSELKSGDILTVRYGSDHPCSDCYYGLIVRIDIEQKTPQAETKEHFGKLSIPVKDLLDIEKKYEINKFHLNYYERSDHEIERNGRLILVLTIT